jgi:hypothetical protein
MKINLSKFQEEEIEWKLGIVCDEPELLEGYGFTEEGVYKLSKTLPSKSNSGGEWELPDWAIEMVKEEMRDYYSILKKINPPEPKKNIIPLNSTMPHIDFQYNDGGRSDAGYSGDAGDCVVRAISNATGIPYQQIYSELTTLAKTHVRNKRDKVARALKRKASKTPRDGAYRKIYEAYLNSIGWKWVAVMGIGTDCTMHVRKDELPQGTLILRLSKHLTCVKDGILVDTYDCSRGGNRAVYGYYVKE